MVNIAIKLYDNTIYPVGDIGSPTGAQTTITTIVDYQKKAEIEVLINQPEYSDKYFPVGKLILNNLPLLKAGEPRIVFTFYLDAASALTIDIADDAVVKKRVKIKKENWEPGIGLVKQPYKDVKASSESLFIIDLSLADEGTLEKETIPPEGSKNKELLSDTDEKDMVIPVLIIISLLVLVFSAVLFFFVIRPWEMTTTNEPEPTRPVPTHVALADTPATTAKTQAEQDTGTREQEVSETQTPSPKPEKPVVDIISLNKVLKEIGPVYFLPNSPDITDLVEIKKLDRIVLRIKDHKSEIFLVIKGHTAKAGTENERQTLSGERARTVRDLLIARGAISKEHCRIEGLGSTSPATTEMIKKGYLNRRVELSVEIRK